MSTFFLVLAVFAVLILAMSVGVLMGRKPISGSCGGMSALGIDTACDICGGDRKKCDEENQRTSQQAKGTDLAYDATRTER
ncbi:MAG: (Na+)-NQR maturation NqrM [Gammaproteobacteria bacterium]|nr:(Na+)-NQR maturation NqrM [Gammaproteobacteria bacterium]